MKKDIIDEYIQNQDENVQEILVNVRKIIETALPEFTISLAYGMPTYKSKRNLIHFAANKNHLGVYPTPKVIEAFSDELKEYKTSKGAVQFPYNKPIPYELIGKMAKYSYDLYTR